MLLNSERWAIIAGSGDRNGRGDDSGGRDRPDRNNDGSSSSSSSAAAAPGAAAAGAAGRSSLVQQGGDGLRACPADESLHLVAPSLLCGCERRLVFRWGRRQLGIISCSRRCRRRRRRQRRCGCCRWVHTANDSTPSIAVPASRSRHRVVVACCACSSCWQVAAECAPSLMHSCTPMHVL